MFILFLLKFISISAHNIDQSQHAENFRGYAYKYVSRPAIDVIKKIQSNLSKATYMTTKIVGSTNPTKETDKIKARFEQIKKDLLSAEQDQVKVVLKKYITSDNFDDPVNHINVCLGIITDIKKASKKYMSQPQQGVIHQEEFPMNLLPLEELKQHDINLDSINLIITDNLPNDEGLPVGMEAYALSPAHNWSMGNGFEIKNDLSVQGLMAVGPKFITLPEGEQQALLIHESEHIIQQHTTTRITLIACIIRTTDEVQEAIINSREWKKLIEIQEQQAEIFPSLRNPRYASIIRAMRGVSHYTGMLYENHYYALSAIDEDWKYMNWVNH